MSHDTYHDELRPVVHAGARVVQIVTSEWERALGLATGLARDLGVPAWHWTVSQGFALHGGRGWEATGEARDQPVAPYLAVAESEAGGVWVIEDPHRFWDGLPVIVDRLRQHCRRRDLPPSVVLLVSPVPGLPAELQAEVPVIELPLPDEAVLVKALERVAGQRGVPFDEHDEDLRRAALGLTLMEAERAFAMAADRFHALDARAVSLVVRQKERVIRRSEALEYYEPDARFGDVGGLDALKTWLERRGLAFTDAARHFGLDAPRGALLLGVQGCGKSLTAKAVAGLWRFPLLRLDVGRIFGGVLGQSEGNLREALRVAEALAPCVLWVDEIEKGLAGVGSSGRTDGGTTARVIGAFLTWMQERRAPVFVVATANRIDQLPPELLRKGRLDEVFFVDLPVRAARAEILAIHLGRKGRDPASFDLEGLAADCAGFSGAELEQALGEALFSAYAEGAEVTDAHLRAAFAATWPLSRTMREEIVGLRAWARARARAAATAAPEPLPAAEQGAPPRLRQELSDPFVPAPTPPAPPADTEGTR